MNHNSGKIQKRLGFAVPELDKDFKLAGGDVVYGQKKDGEAAVFVSHAEQLKPLVLELAALEEEVQMSWHSLKYRWMAS